MPKYSLDKLLLNQFSGEWGAEDGETLTPVLRTANFNEDGSFDYASPALRFIDAKKVAKKRMLRGDIVLEKSGGTPHRPVGIMAYYDSDQLALCSNFNHVLRFNPDIILPRFAFHELRWLKMHAAFEPYTRKTTGLQNLQMKKFVELELGVPAMEEQERAVSLLDEIGVLQDCCRQQISKYDELVKSRFVEMFGDPCEEDTKHPKARIDSFCELRIGPFGSALHKEDYVSGGHPLVNPSHIIEGRVVVDENLTIDDEKFENMNAYHLHAGDVVLGRRGEIGRCAVVESEGMICGTGSMIMRPSAACRSDYLQRVVSFPSFASAMERNAVGVTMKNLNAKIVGSAMVSLPSLELQDEHAAFVQQVDKLKYGGRSDVCPVGVKYMVR